MDVSVPTHDWVVGFGRGTGRRAAACLAEIEGRRSQQRSAEICQKTGRFGIRRRGH